MYVQNGKYAGNIINEIYMNSKQITQIEIIVQKWAVFTLYKQSIE
jgi:hypothetical protein